MPFLASQDPRPLTQDVPAGFRPSALYLGRGGQALEVAVFEATRKPTVAEVRQLHRNRVANRAAPVVAVVLYGDSGAALAGPAGDSVEVAVELPRLQAERLCLAALGAQDRHAAIRFLGAALAQLGAPIPGLRNAGLFALHELEAGVPARSDWTESKARAQALLALRGRELIQQLGFTIQAQPGPESILVANGRDLAIALFLERADEIDPPNQAFGNVSPVSAALARADQKNLDYVVIAAGATLRLYPVKPGIGTGRRGRTETFVEVNLDLLGPQHAGYLWLLYSADALTTQGSFEAILAASTDYAADLGGRLRERVYTEVVPALADALVRARRLRTPSPEKLRETYELALLVLFRLLFVAYAEDKELLPLHQNEAYRKHSLKEMARQLADAKAKGTPPADEEFYWREVAQLWKAVDKGNPGWGVPAYNGGLFTSDRGPGEVLSRLALKDTEFVPALAALLVDETAEGTHGPIDFRSLGVREFGTIYEGLLESELSLAESDLAVDARGAYVPVRGRATVLVREGEIYLHDASGARKSTGSYYTKDFAVDHLLDHTLEPALTAHLTRLDKLEPREAAARFFEFRVADIAMGSGHFLVSAVDRIERHLSNYLARRSLPGVLDELERLRKTAVEALGPDWSGDPIEDTQLLRRQIARRCVHGVDLNPVAVELARLSLWIHTFVPGLPLSFLDGTLVNGNALVGVATLDEARELLAGEDDLFSMTAEDLLSAARAPLEKLARLSEATAAEVKQARQFYAAALEATRGTQDLLTVLAASRIDGTIASAVGDRQVSTRFRGGQADVFSDALVRKAERALAGLAPLHFPVAFPQVFLGGRGGFDVILGNPPWEEATVEEDAFWARHFPGLRSLPQREQEARKASLRRGRTDLVAEYEREVEEAEKLRTILTAGAFPGMGTGDPELYKAFCWRFWELVARDGGYIGVVLPRSALSAKGSTDFRQRAFTQAAGIDITTLLNNANWVFPEVHPQYTIGLVSIQRGASADTEVRLRGPYASLARYRAGVVKEPIVIPGSAIKRWNDTASLPLLDGQASADVLAQLRKSPRLDLDDGRSWRARPQTEFHATNDKRLMDLRSKECPEGYWPVYKGESFDLWTPDTGTYYAWANPRKVIPELLARRTRSARKRDSAVAEFPGSWLQDEGTLPCLGPRIAFRDVSRSTDSRTVRVALVPGRVILANTAPYLLWPRGTPRDVAFLLGVLSSLPLDWYARRFVETHLNYFVFNPFPVPRPRGDHPLARMVVETAARLVGSHKGFGSWVKALGVAPGKLPADEKDDLIHQLDAVVAHLYGLSERQLVHIFETFHVGWDYQDRLDTTLKHFGQLKRLS